MPFDPVRPTKRALADLDLAAPDIGRALHELLDDVVLDAQRVPELHAADGVARIVSLTDRVWFRLRSGRVRSAVVRLTASEHAAAVGNLETTFRWWLGASGSRRADSGDDFYASLLQEAQRHGGKKAPSTDHLLPQDWDRRRLLAELAFAWQRHLREMVLRLIASSLQTGQAAAAEYSRHRITAVARADDGETYLAITATGVANPKTIAVILASVPGVPAEDWQAEPGGAAGITPEPGEIIWSTLLPPEAAAAVLDLAGQHHH